MFNIFSIISTLKKSIHLNKVNSIVFFNYFLSSVEPSTDLKMVFRPINRTSIDRPNSSRINQEIKRKSIIFERKSIQTRDIQYKKILILRKCWIQNFCKIDLALYLALFFNYLNLTFIEFDHNNGIINFSSKLICGV